MKIIGFILVMLLMVGSAYAIGTYDDDITISGYFNGKINQTLDTKYIVWYENGNTYASSQGNIVYSGTNNATVLQNALNNADKNGEVKIVSNITINSNITVPAGITLSSIVHIPTVRAAWDSNKGDVLNNTKLLLNTSNTIYLNSGSVLKDIAIIASDINPYKDWADDYPVYNGTAITLLAGTGNWIIEDSAIFGFNLGVYKPGTSYGGRFQHLNMDNTNGFRFENIAWDIIRIDDIHMWNFVYLDTGNGSKKGWRNGDALKSERCDGCIITRFFAFRYNNGIMINGSIVPITLTDNYIDLVSSNDGIGYKFTNNTEGTIANSIAVGTGGTSISFYTDSTSMIQYIGTRAQSSNIGYYAESGAKYSYVGTFAETYGNNYEEAGNSLYTFDSENLGNVIADKILAKKELSVLTNLNEDNQLIVRNDYSGKAAKMIVKANSLWTQSGYIGSTQTWYTGMVGDATYRITDSTNNKEPFKISTNSKTNSLVITTTGIAVNGTINMATYGDNGKGITMKSPDGTTYCLTIANGGTTNVTAGACS